MKAVILAAGMGTRMGSLIPKTLTAIKNETTILDYQIEKLSKVVGKDNIIVVVGYKKELIMEMYPELMYVYNPAFTKTNTSKSLLCAIKKINEDFIFLNGDVYFEIDVLKKLIESEKSSILVNTSTVADEEVKYNTNEFGYIRELSKEVKYPLGEAVGINKVIKEDIKLLKEQLEMVDDKDYFEKAFENISLDRKIELLPISIDQYYVREIDFIEDLQEVQEYLKMNRI